jgi:glycosyltransferase involved in cell wall biosynthesis
MMVKNEEKNLESCLQSLQPLRNAVASELIIVDTGSEDDTVEIAKGFTDQVYFHPWGNDFSAMRNITLKYSTGEWVLIIDADEVLKNCQPVIDFLQSPKRKQYASLAISIKNMVDVENDIFSSMVAFRFFRNDGYFHFEGAIHNQAKFKGETLAMPEVYLLHYGYIPTDKELMERIFLRTGTILKQELEKDPGNIYYWTQLSVTYAMHKDYKEAIEYAEKAYSLLPEKKTSNFMFVLLQMILVYQHESQYEKVANICRESLAIKEGYLDVYYYYAEAQAVLKNYPDAIIYYEKYLDLLAKQEQQQEKDVTIIEYTVGFQQLVYSNLLRLYKEEENYIKAIACVQKLTDKQLIKGNLQNIIYLYVALEKYADLRNCYEKHIEEGEGGNFIDQLTKVLKEADKDAERKAAEVFCDLSDMYGLLCKLILEDRDGYITPLTQERVANIEFGNLPIYCSEILYYLLKWHYPLEKFIVNFREKWLACVIDYINKYHEDLSVILYNYLQKYTCKPELHEYKLGKELSRYVLLLGKMNEIQYKEVFFRYLDNGIHYLQLVYNPLVLENALIYEMKNDEETFLAYMYQAQLHKNDNPKEYVKSLRNALKAFPALKKGIELLLQELQQKGGPNKLTEFEQYKVQVKRTIENLIANGKFVEANNILNEYKSIVPNDLEAIFLESKILLN